MNFDLTIWLYEHKLQQAINETDDLIKEIVK